MVIFGFFKKDSLDDGQSTPVPTAMQKKIGLNISFVQKEKGRYRVNLYLPFWGFRLCENSKAVGQADLMEKTSFGRTSAYRRTAERSNEGRKPKYNQFLICNGGNAVFCFYKVKGKHGAYPYFPFGFSVIRKYADRNYLPPTILATSAARSSSLFWMPSPLS